MAQERRWTWSAIRTQLEWIGKAEVARMSRPIDEGGGRMPRRRNAIETVTSFFLEAPLAEVEAVLITGRAIVAARKDGLLADAPPRPPREKAAKALRAAAHALAARDTDVQ